MDKFDVTCTIKALIVSRKGGMPIEELDSEYEEQEGSQIPYLKLGYSSLFHYLREIKEIKQNKNSYGNTVLTVNDSKVSHLNEMIKKQKPSKNKNKNNRRNKNKSKQYYDLQWRQNLDRSSDNYSWSISSGYKSCSTSFEEERDRVPTIFINPRHTNKHIHEPIYNESQLIGDDFFLQLAIKNLEVPIWRREVKSALYSGLCVSGQSIRDCIRRLEKVDSISDRVTIMLGAVDIYKGNTIEQMEADYRELLNLLEVKFNLSRNSITICTIPPLANMSFMTDFERWSTLKLFNQYLRRIVNDDYNFDYEGYFTAYNMQDFYLYFTNDIDGINYNLFQNDARYVSGTRQSWVLFNRRGRRLAMDLLS